MKRYFLYPRVSFLSKNKFVTGSVYGIFVWVIMTRIVLPLSNTPHIPFNFLQAVIGLLFIIFAIGLPISLMAHKFYTSKYIA